MLFGMRIGLVTATLLTTIVSVLGSEPDPCADKKSHQFNFWIGEWNVTADGKPVGTGPPRSTVSTEKSPDDPPAGSSAACRV